MVKIKKAYMAYSTVQTSWGEDKVDKEIFSTFKEAEKAYEAKAKTMIKEVVENKEYGEMGDGVYLEDLDNDTHEPILRRIYFSNDAEPYLGIEGFTDKDEALIQEIIPEWSKT
jgi:hypothetical protein